MEEKVSIKRLMEISNLCNTIIEKSTTNGNNGDGMFHVAVDLEKDDWADSMLSMLEESGMEIIVKQVGYKIRGLYITLS